MHTSIIIIIFVLDNDINNNQIKSFTTMIKFEVNNEIEVNLPTSIKEITNEYLTSVATEITVANYHTLIALITVSNLKDMAFSCVSNKTKNGITASVIPVFVKKGKDDNVFYQSINTGDRILISRTAIEMGDHVRLSNNLITPGNIANYLKLDDKLRTSIINNKFFEDKSINVIPNIYMVEFKMIADSDIHGFYKESKLLHNPFVNKMRGNLE